MTNAVAVKRDETVADSLEAQAIFRGAELIATQRIAQINDALARCGVEYRVFPGEPRLTEAAMALAEAQNYAHTPDNDEQVAEVSRVTRALDLTQHDILAEVLAAHVRGIEVRLVSAVGAFRQANEIGLGLGMDIEEWIPTGECAALFSGVAQLKLVAPGDAAETPAERKRTARAYRTGLKDGQAGAVKLAALEAELLRGGLAAVLDVLADALIDEDRAKTIVWYSVLTRMVAKPAD